MADTGDLIYIVTKGSYSDYEIMQAFSTKEKAEEYVRWRCERKREGTREWLEMQLQRREARTEEWAPGRIYGDYDEEKAGRYFDALVERTRRTDEQIIEDDSIKIEEFCLDQEYLVSGGRRGRWGD